MKNWQVLKSYAMLGEKQIDKGCFITYNELTIRVAQTDDCIMFSDFDTGVLLYVWFKNGVDYLSDWATEYTEV